MSLSRRLPAGGPALATAGTAFAASTAAGSAAVDDSALAVSTRHRVFGR
jgi:hypothetical protein